MSSLLSIFSKEKEAPPLAGLLFGRALFLKNKISKIGPCYITLVLVAFVPTTLGLAIVAYVTT
jgi:hypothetical protein